MAENLTQTITDLENQTWQALQTAGKDFLPFLSKDCQMLFPLGMRVSHSTVPNLTQVMTSEAFEPWQSYKMKEVEVTPIGQDGAVITYKAEATKSDKDPIFRSLIATIWRKDSDQWLLCLSQQTPYDEEI